MLGIERERGRERERERDGGGGREREGLLSKEIDAAGPGNTVDAAECRNRCCWV
jgi:hypothetical protein